MVANSKPGFLSKSGPVNRIRQPIVMDAKRKPMSARDSVSWSQESSANEQSRGVRVPRRLFSSLWKNPPLRCGAPIGSFIL